MKEIKGSSNIFMKIAYALVFFLKQLMMWGWAEIAARIMTSLEKQQNIKEALIVTGIYLAVTLIGHALLYKFEAKLNYMYEIRMKDIQYGVVNEYITGNGITKKFSELEIINRVNGDISNLFQWEVRTKPELFMGMGAVVGIFFYLGYSDWVMTLILYVLLVMNFIVPSLFNKHMVADYSEVMQANDKWANRLQEAIHNFFTIRRLNAEKEYHILYGDDVSEFVNAVGKANKTFYIENGIKTGLGQFVSYMGYIVVGIFVIIGSIDFSGAAKVVIMIPTLQNIMNMIVEKYRERRNIVVSKKRIEDLAPKRISSTEEPRNYVVQINNLEFGYDENSPVFSDLNYKISQGECILIKGENGTGKSTLLKLLTGLYEIQSGSITIGDVDTNKIPCDWLKNNVYYLPQTTLYIPGTVEDNLKFRGISKEHGLDSDILKQDVSELSEGQKKKIALEELYNCNKKLLLMDEPENHLDAETLEQLIEFLRNDQRTKIIVTHSDKFDSITPHKWNLTKDFVCDDI